MKIGSLTIDKNVLEDLNDSVNKVLNIACLNSSLKSITDTFQQEHDADKVSFGLDDADNESHFRRTLERMIDLSVSLSCELLQRSVDLSKENSSSCIFSVSLAASQLSGNKTISFPDDSVSWRQQSATLTFLCASILSLAVLVSPELRKQIQVFILKRHVLEYVSEALTVSKEHEMSYYIEGQKTELVRLLANITYKNKEICDIFSCNHQLLFSLLSSTQIDENNPMIGEWAKFTVRNLCELSVMAQERIKTLKAISLSPESEKLAGAQRLSMGKRFFPAKNESFKKTN